ncbi:MAG: tetratricopeptide repeat protein [Planctomycetota bacterium]|nr:tetratricopeptide repeat protein [Planctomycetota bacterium]
MAIRQEQIVFAVVLVACGALVATSGSDSKRAPRPAQALELEPVVVPETARVLPRSSATPGSFARDLFKEPTNARPMPALAFVAPPLLALPSLAAPPMPGPAAHGFGATLRQDLSLGSAPGLFDERGASDDFTSAELDFEAELPGDTLSILRDLGYVPDEVELLVEEPDRAARIESYKQLYDWIRLDEFDYHFGSIDNRMRYRLGERPGEAVQFTEVDPSTGQARYLGAGSVEYPRARVTEFGFADTVVNAIELGAIAREVPITRGNLSERLAFAAWCVDRRHDAPRALEVARDLYERAALFDPSDPEPRLGLGACLEAGFQFEEAFTEYRALAETYPKSAAVAARLASLEERFLSLDAAEARLRDAVRFDRGSYVGHWALGTFLLRHGTSAKVLTEARDSLVLAGRFAPDTPEDARLRAEIRADLGAAHLAVGDVAAAESAFSAALSADAKHQAAMAGLFACDYLRLLAGEQPKPRKLPFDLQGLGPELLSARGLLALEAGDYKAARSDLEAAVVAGPVRAHRPLSALSRLAEATGYDEEAMEYVERALEVSPKDPWALYQRGRLLVKRDDLEGAEASFSAALAVDVDFVDAVLALGDLAMEEGRHNDAERYFDRVRRLESERLDVEVRRGLNALFLGQQAIARERFEGARALADRDPVALGGLAWCEYLAGRSTEALNLLATLDDARRTYGDEDPWRAWSMEQKERIEDHLEKRRWVDVFDRKSLRNDWLVEEGAGPLVSLQDERLVIEGQFNRNDGVRVFRQVPAAAFVSLEADVTVDASTAGRAGLFVAREQDRKGSRTTSAMVRVMRHKDGSLQTHLLRAGRPDLGPQDVTWLSFPTGEPVRLRIERDGPETAATINVYVDGTPVLVGAPMSSFGKTMSDVALGFFVEGESGRRVRLEVDNVEIVRRQS